MDVAHGDYPAGWALLFERWIDGGYAGQTRAARPFADLSSIKGHSVAVVREGGFGDMFQFFRYIPRLAQDASSVVLQVHPTEVRLLHANLPLNVVMVLSDQRGAISEANIPAEVEHVTALFDLPYHFRTTLGTIPAVLPYLRLPSMPQKHGGPRKRVGLVWAGGPHQWYDAARSIAVEAFTNWADLDIDFVSLQLGGTAAPFLSVLRPDGDWLDTAAVIQQLDLVISVDTAVAHLTGALGVPIWLLSRAEPCWRWLHNQPTSPWYPCIMRVFGQTVPCGSMMALPRVRKRPDDVAGTRLLAIKPPSSNWSRGVGMVYVAASKLSPAAEAARRRQVLGLRKRGLTYVAIAAQVGTSTTEVFRICKRFAAIGDKVPAASAAQEKQRRQIVDLRQRGLTYAAIAARLRISPSWASTVCHRFDSATEKIP